MLLACYLIVWKVGGVFMCRGVDVVLYTGLCSYSMLVFWDVWRMIGYEI